MQKQSAEHKDEISTRKDIVKLLGEISQHTRWALGEKEKQLSCNLWTINDGGSRENRLQSFLNKNGERTHRLTWGSISDIMPDGQASKAKSVSKPKIGGFGGGFGMGNRSFSLKKPGESKTAVVPKANTAPVKGRGFVVARADFRFPSELLDPEISDEKRQAILATYKGDKSKVKVLKNDKSTRDAMNDIANDVHIIDLEVLKASFQAEGLAHHIFQGLKIRKKLPIEKGWNVKTGWIISSFVSLKSIFFGLNSLFGANSMAKDGKVESKSLEAIMDSLKATMTKKFQPKKINGKRYHICTVKVSFDWEAVQEKYPGLSKTLDRLHSCNLVLTDRHKLNHIAYASYDGKEKTLVVQYVTDDDSKFLWHRIKKNIKENDDEDIVERIACVDKEGNFLVGDLYCKDAVRVALEKVQVLVLGVTFSLPTMEFLLYRKVALRESVDGICFVRLEVRPVEMQHTFMSSLLGWMLGLEKLFEYCIRSYRCTFGFHWPEKYQAKGADDDIQKLQNQGDLVAKMWDVPGTFAVTLEMETPRTKSDTLQKLIQKQTEKEKYLEGQVLLLKMLMAISNAFSTCT
mmetsp:Transcript_45080/g.72451  ORF Transcript_45080/g.72451 Transcript_45080/m.72451 type:complete len:574 (-) Transcript_45080:339-2060(-)